ncbi:F-box domain-containing protein [Pycnococcus provasolii]
MVDAGDTRAANNDASSSKGKKRARVDASAARAAAAAGSSSVPPPPSDPLVALSLAMKSLPSAKKLAESQSLDALSAAMKKLAAATALIKRARAAAERADAAGKVQAWRASDGEGGMFAPAAGPLSRLPNECVLHILHRAGTARQLARLSLVNKAWRDALARPEPYVSLDHSDLTMGNASEVMEFLSNEPRLACVKHVDINSKVVPGKNLLTVLHDKLPDLRSLNMAHGGSIGESNMKSIADSKFSALVAFGIKEPRIGQCAALARMWQSVLEANVGLRVLLYHGYLTATVTNNMLMDAANLPSLERLYLRDVAGWERREDGMVFDRWASSTTEDGVPMWRFPQGIYGRTVTNAPTTDTVLSLIDKRLYEVVIRGLTPTRFDADTFRAELMNRGFVDCSNCVPEGERLPYNAFDNHLREAALKCDEPHTPASTTYIDVEVANDVTEMPQVQHTRICGYLHWPPK